MNPELITALTSITAAAPEKIVVSNPLKDSVFKRVNVTLSGHGYQAEKLTETQAFHENLEAGGLTSYLAGLLDKDFAQLHAWDKNTVEYAVKITKSGKILVNRHSAGSAPTVQKRHNREKNYLIPEGAEVPALHDMGIFTSDGRVAANMYDKFRQINRFLEMIDDVFKTGCPNPIRVMDFGCGKSYLTFLTYHYFTQIRGVGAEITGLDLKEDVIGSCKAAAERYGYDGLYFQKADIAEYTDFNADLLITLHACDTATDYALYNAIKNNVGVIMAVPCCQHELNAQLRPKTLSLFSRYGILKERTAAVITDAIRANILTCAGYKTQVLEFVDLSHTPKNVLIRAVKSNIPREKRQEAYNEVVDTIKEFKLDPTLFKLYNREIM